jgi:hypothetical protein
MTNDGWEGIVDQASETLPATKFKFLEYRLGGKETSGRSKKQAARVS